MLIKLFKITDKGEKIMKITEYAKNLKKYAKDFKKKALAKTAMLVGLSVTLTACGTTSQDKAATQNEKDGVVIVQEVGTAEPIETIIEEVQETTNENGDTVKISEGKTENGDTVKITETTNENGETIKVTETTNENGETIIVTESTNENGETVKVTESTNENGETIVVTEKINENGETVEEITTQEPTTERPTNNVTTAKTTTNNTTTTKTTTKTTAKTTTPVTTTKVTTTTTQTTQKPIVTTIQTTTTQATTTQTQPVTQPPRTDYTKYDLLDPNTAVAAAAFEKLSDDLCAELFNGYLVTGNYGATAGYEQSKIILAALNYNSGISSEVLAYDEALGNMSREDVIKYSVNADLAQEQHLYGTRVDFNKYVLDDNLANDIEDITNKYFDWYDNNSESMYNYIVTYSENNNIGDVANIDNYVKFYMVCKIYDQMFGCDDDLSEQVLNDNLIIPMYESYEPYKGNSYRR